MPSGFNFIDAYTNMARCLDEETDYLLTDVDQQDRHSKLLSQVIEIKPQLNLEEVEGQQDPFSRIIATNNSSGSNNITDCEPPGCNNYYTCSTYKANHNNLDNQLVSNTRLMTTTPSFFTSSPTSLQITSTTNTCTFPSAPKSTLAPRNSTIFPEMESNGNSGVPIFDFLTDSDFATGFCSSETNPLYTDLNCQQGSLTYDYQSVPGQSKPGVVLEETKRLEEAAILMMDTIYKDCNNLRVPYDPMMWTPEHVRRWVSWVCHRNGVLDVSTHLSHSDGPALCSMSENYLYLTCGESGIKLSNELELWKAANTCFSNQSYVTSGNDQAIFQTQPFHVSTSQSFNLATRASPALSSCSSNHDSIPSSISTHSDPSDDESPTAFGKTYNSTLNRCNEDNGYSKILNKIPAGRGHKQTIHLWQFLKELLVSKEVNYSDCIRWLDRKTGVFKIEDSKKVATLWGARKNRPLMNYDKLSRSVRQYYKKGIIKKTEQSKRLVYQFCPGYM